jgi:hypothetical protein
MKPGPWCAGAECGTQGACVSHEALQIAVVLARSLDEQSFAQPPPLILGSPKDHPQETVPVVRAP